mgnify:CR=1 FL=1
MKQFIVDANVIFSAIISGKEEYQEKFSKNQLFVPDFALDEIQKYQAILLKKLNSITMI